MRKAYICLLLATSIFAADSLVYGEQNSKVYTQTQKSYKTLYSVRFLSVSKKMSYTKMFHSIPEELRDGTRIVPSGNYLLAIYKERDTKTAVQKDLSFIKAMGYKDAYIRSKTKSLDKKVKKNTTVQEPKKKQQQVNTLSKFTTSRIISKANSAYKKGDYMQAIIFYEMLVSSGSTSRKVKNNLCYLYGRVGAFLQAEAIIDKDKYPAKLIYAYAYGSATTGQENFYSNLSKYIPYDKSGKLMLLSGYYFEMKHKMDRSLAFYKMAYETNPTDSYTLYAYARAEDIQNHIEKALRLYKKIVATSDASMQIYKEAQKRIYQIGS